jgi:hypothetical protein
MDVRAGGRPDDERVWGRGRCGRPRERARDTVTTRLRENACRPGVSARERVTLVTMATRRTGTSASTAREGVDDVETSGTRKTNGDL